MLYLFCVIHGTKLLHPHKISARKRDIFALEPINSQAGNSRILVYLTSGEYFQVLPFIYTI